MLALSSSPLIIILCCCVTLYRRHFPPLWFDSGCHSGRGTATTTTTRAAHSDEFTPGSYGRKHPDTIISSLSLTSTARNILWHSHTCTCPHAFTHWQTGIHTGLHIQYIKSLRHCFAVCFLLQRRSFKRLANPALSNVDWHSFQFNSIFFFDVVPITTEIVSRRFTRHRA